MSSEGKAGAGSGPLAVLMLTHRGPAQIARLVSRLTGDGNTMVAVHHDPNGEPLTLRPSSSVALVPDPVPCPWGRLSRAVAIRKSLRWLRENLPEMSWVLVISGQDYPIRTMASIRADLAAAGCDAFVRHYRLDGDPHEDVHPWQTVTRQRYLYRRRVPGSARSYRLPWPRPYPFPGGEGLYAGSHWCNLSARAVDKVVDSPLNEPLLHYLRRSPLPDEAWTATAVVSGKPELTVVNDRRRYIRWPGKSSHPVALTPEDLPQMRASSDFFARKVNLAKWPEACDALDSLADSRE